MNALLLNKVSSENTSAEEIKSLLQKNADPNAQCFHTIFENNTCSLCKYATNCTMAALNIELKKNKPSFEVIKILLAYKANPNHKPYLENTPFLSLCYKENASLDLVKLLLEYKADPTITTYQDSNALHLICDKNPSPREFVKVILKSQIHYIKPHEFQGQLSKHFEKFPEFKSLITLYLLILKTKKIKIPKFVLFKILKICIEETITLEKIKKMIFAKTSYHKTPFNLACERNEYKLSIFEETSFFLSEIRQAIEQKNYYAVVMLLE